jgi:threonyl-tRNA synthetase
VIHRSSIGAIERTMAFLIEHYAGAFPVWMSPVQVMVVPISDKNLEYAAKVEAELKAIDVRVQVDNRNERMNQKIREAQLQKIPYMLVVGDKEAAENKVAVRLRSGEQLPVMSLDDFKTKIKQMISERVNELKP